MKICSKCSRKFNDQEDADYNPARELEDIFLKHTIGVNSDDLCPECIEELGRLNLMGFGK
jgi:hypothetical protein